MLRLLVGGTWRGFAVPHDRHNSREVRLRLARWTVNTQRGYEGIPPIDHAGSDPPLSSLTREHMPHPTGELSPAPTFVVARRSPGDHMPHPQASRPPIHLRRRQPLF